MYKPFKILSVNHFLMVALCIFCNSVYLPRLFLGVDKQAEKRLRLTLVFFVLSFKFDFYKVVYLFGEPWKTALPFHLCDFSALSITAYL